MILTQSTFQSTPLTEDALTDLCLRFRPDKAAQARDSSLCVTPLITEMIVDGKTVPLRLQEDRWGSGVVRVSTVQQRSGKAYDDQFTKSGRKKDQGYSEEEQIRRAIRYFVREGLAFKIYSDAGVGGEYPCSDPNLIKRLLAKKASRYRRIFERVLLDETSRSRRSVEQITGLETYLTARVKHIESNGISDEELYTPSSSLAEETSKRIRRGRLKRRAFFRQGFSQLWDDVRADKVHTVTATDRSRLCRDADLEMAFLETVAQHNVKIKGLIEDLSNLDISDAIKKGMNYMVASLHEARLEETATAVFRGRVQRLESGEIYRQLPWWLQRDSQRNIFLPEDKRDVVKRIIAMFLAGQAEGRISRKLYADGVTIDGSPLTIGKVRQAINSDSIFGINRGYGITWQNLPAVITDNSVIEEIVEARHARSINNPNKDFMKWRNHLFSSLLRCHCGKGMRFDTRANHIARQYYRCIHENKKSTNTAHATIHGDDLTAFITELVVSHPHLITGQLTRSLLGSDFPERTMRRQFLEVELRTATAAFETMQQAELDSARKRALEEQDAEPDSEEFNQLVRIYSRKNLRQEIAALEKLRAEFDGLSVHLAEEKRYTKLFSDIDSLQGWVSLDDLARRRLLQSIFESITVNPCILGRQVVLKLRGVDTPLPPVRMIAKQRAEYRFPSVSEWVEDMTRPDLAERAERDVHQFMGIRVSQLTPFYEYVRFRDEDWAQKWLLMFRDNPTIYRRCCRRERLKRDLVRCGISDEMLTEFDSLWDQYMKIERQRILGPAEVEDTRTHLTVGYLYVAGVTQKAEDVLREQRRELETGALAQSHQIDIWIKDIGSRRKGLSGLIDKARKGQIDHVYVTSADRLGRDSQQFLGVLNRLAEHGVSIWSTSQGELDPKMLTTTKAIHEKIGRRWS